MKSFEPKDLPINLVQQFLLGGVAPRPIALVSTISTDGINNLAPFSFYNAFGANPPIVAFSPARRGRDNVLKDTYGNLIETNECVINAVSYSMVEQINLASCEYPKETDEFVKSGFTAINSDLVKAKRVKESLFQMECKLLQMLHTGDTNGAANIAICEVVKFHINEEIIPSDGIGVDSFKLDLIGRSGGNLYTRANDQSLFEVRKPGIMKGMGFDNLPSFLLNSEILSANNLAQIAVNDTFPDYQDTLNWLDLLKTDFQITNLENANLEPSNEGLYVENNDYMKLFLLGLNSNQRQQLLIEKSIKCALNLNAKKVNNEIIVDVLNIINWFINSNK